MPEANSRGFPEGTTPIPISVNATRLSAVTLPVIGCVVVPNAMAPSVSNILPEVSPSVPPIVRVSLLNA